ncbi:4Fe-4S dicluster domain-containing protein [Tumebacillus sp. DT12]|uniref:Ferredoxin-like protein n=1 Tax=Tumebacillus lacus TaxID=2995335 RepID=A0ABT3X3U0_9BACL|nr:4Fe-4S dicluster domain-containing protein [Tumebacillus lacus]MCX7571559.1 4Fe-4S dicluster domain-containing protein [Tumebacillus lacus]
MSEEKAAPQKGASIEEKLFTIRYKVDDISHLIIKDQEVCMKCETKECNDFCPADVYSWRDLTTHVAFENCIECGTCRIGCPTYNIEWVYPKGGYGITYKFG